MKKILLITAALAILLFLVSGCERKVVNQASNEENTACFTCHNGDGRIETADAQWRNSLHGSGRVAEYGNRPASSGDCARCHNQPGFIEWVNTGALAGAPYANWSAIGCHTCHKPHESGNLELRTTAAVTLLGGATYDHGKSNLCVACHHSRQDVRAVPAIGDSLAITSSRWGPHHGPQGEIINGTGAFQYPGETYPTSSPHVGALTDVCVDCHMGSAQIEEGYNVGGHSWNMFEESTGTNLTANCIPCHSTMPARAASYDDMPAAADYDHNGTIEGVQTEVLGLVDSLKTLLVADSLLNNSTGLIRTQKIEGGKLGAIYNYLIIEGDRSEGIHNYPYTLALLNTSVAYMAAHMYY